MWKNYSLKELLELLIDKSYILQYYIDGDTTGEIRIKNNVVYTFRKGDIDWRENPMFPLWSRNVSFKIREIIPKEIHSILRLSNLEISNITPDTLGIKVLNLEDQGDREYIWFSNSGYRITTRKHDPKGSTFHYPVGLLDNLHAIFKNNDSSFL